MVESNSCKKGKDIWSLISLDQLATAITSLGDRIDQLQNESWRLNLKTKSTSSSWTEVIDRLHINDDEKNRHSLYSIWRSNRHNIRNLVDEKRKNIHINTALEDDTNNRRKNDFDVEKVIAPLSSEPSLPPMELPKTRAVQKAAASGKIYQRHCMRTEFISLTRTEWKNAYSRSEKKTKNGWTGIFDEKLKTIGNTCVLKFHSANITSGLRKSKCADFWFSTVCTGTLCDRKYIVSHRKEMNDNLVAVFRVDVYGEENHCEDNEMRPRKINIMERELIGKRANVIGPLATFRELVDAADEKLLAAGNFSACPTIEAVKKCSSDYRKKMRFDEDVFKECRILSRFYHKEDVSSEKILGYIHNLGEIPFRSHLFTEPQLRRYIRYIENKKYSIIHIDSTGGILKPMKDQNQSLLYTIMFKDGNDPNDNTPLAHAILTDHTVPGIGYFLGNVIHSVNQVTTKQKLRPPSFIVIDFSAALMNAALQQFNVETVNKHLKRCWNVIHGKYSADRIRSLSFIHLCCCHVMNAFARSLNAEKVEKNTREAVLYIFAYMLCCNDLNQLYNTLGLVIDIFGDPNEQNAKSKLEQICALKLNVDQESEIILKDFDKIFRTAEENAENLKLVDEYFDSDEPIIHQSPFNKEAIRRYPRLNEIVINRTLKESKSNLFFSSSIVRLFYRWWAYLPLWTGLLFDFEEKYANDTQKNPSVTNLPIRYSNAVIESYFRTFKKSICQGKRSKAPQEVIMALHRSVKVQSKADKYQLTQSSKGRKRKKYKPSIIEKWKKRTHEKTRRSKYTNLIEKFASKRTRQKEDQSQVDSVTKKYSASENNTSDSSSNKSESSSQVSSERNSFNESFRSSREDAASSSEQIVKVSDQFCDDFSIDLDVPSKPYRQKNEISLENNLNTSSSLMISDSNLVGTQQTLAADCLAKTTSIKIESHAEIKINDISLKSPNFEIRNFLYRDHVYSLENTCALDSALFSIYFIYMTDEAVSAEFKEASKLSPYSTLAETFNIVETDGWDAARVYWLLKHNILKTTNRVIKKNLFGSVDQLVFSFVKHPQQYSYDIICSRSDCPKKENTCTSTELHIISTNDHIARFESEIEGSCGTMAKYTDEISEAEALRKRYKLENMPIFNCETDKTEYTYAWRCAAPNIQTSSTFDYGHPLILIVNITSPSKREEEGYEPTPARFRDLKYIIRICSMRYQLRAVINHRNMHFTATLIGPDKQLYFYDDLQGVTPIRSSSHPIEYAIYTQIDDL